MATPPIQLQACLGDPDGVSEYRWLVDGKDIKYVTVDPGLLPENDLGSEPALRQRLPAFPPGDWNEGHVAQHGTTGQAVFASTTRRTLARLHALGIRHGDVNKHNFLVTADGAAVLVDFECAARCDDAQALAKERASLQEQLEDDTGRGGLTAWQE